MTSRNRRYQRSGASLKVDYPDLQAFLHDYTENISRGGTFISSERNWAVSDELRLTLSFPGLLKPIHVLGRVAWVRSGSEPGIGVEFVFDEHPEGKDKLERLVEAIERGDQSTIARRVQILIVEDNPLIFDLLQGGLSRLALKDQESPRIFTFHSASDGAAALEQIKRESFDMVIADFYLPVLGGETFIHRCRDIVGPSLPIITVSAGGPDAREQALAAGADLFLGKPLRLLKVFDTVVKLLADAEE